MRRWGINTSTAGLGEALRVSAEQGLPRYESLQPLYNIYERVEYEAELEAVCVRNDLGVISYFSLASGFLTGKYRSEADLGKTHRGSRVKKYLNQRGYRILAGLDEVRRSSIIPIRHRCAGVADGPAERDSTNCRRDHTGAT